MSRLQKPLARAQIEGRHIVNAGRYKRNEPTSAALGDPPKWMADAQAIAWHEFEAEQPWLNRSHRALVEIACNVRARLTSGQDVGTKALSLLRLCLSSMGATPADASKVSWASEPDDIFD
jgi:hypothetical protein